MTTPATDDGLTRNYRAAFLRYLPRQDEAALAAAYDLGRSSLHDGVSVLDLVTVHHHVLGEVVRATVVDDVDDVVRRAGEFLAEVLATSDMVQRSLQRD
ncbi:phosphatase RsbU N-terminal domain-containing protein [Knoellia koreensis]|uniref:Phosphoserine phosphatase RsbU N-terminal domain-containing protein n=1 Tax=Knoellia koreensis TaxID=2730921 RepID=A0A849HJA0_9MICO|nr:phosphatase RsbU N-terminal domain-containing protein [Knoellia sp. DB2414S]NNM46723.1 hypothetical protein [Knoellia sp. DB2414S]